MVSKLSVAVLLIVIAVPVSEGTLGLLMGLLKGGSGGGGGGGCCPPPPCGGGCGRKKREVIERPPVFTDESKKSCNNPSILEAIEESLDEDVKLSTEALNKRLHMDSSAEYIAWCTLRHQKYKFATRLTSYCASGNANVTCHVFQQ